MSTKVLQTPREWYECLEAGCAAVRRPFALSQFQRPGVPRLSVFHIPSFVDATGWTIYYLPREKSYKLQTVIWRQQADGRRMEDVMHGRVLRVSPEPTLEERYSDFSRDSAEQMIATLGRITIPLLARQNIGCDGESFGVRVEHNFEVEWWCDGPKEWAELTRWARDSIDVLLKKNA